MAEAPAEKYLRDEVRKRGGISLKLVIMGKRNFPDRTNLIPGGRIFFVEAKDEGKDLRKTQRWFTTKILIPLGFTVYICRTKLDVDEIIKHEMEGSRASNHLRRLRIKA